MNSIYSIIIILYSFNVSAIIYKESSQKLGINFKHDDGRKGQFQMTETSGSGVAWIDYNNDDYLDLLIINGSNGTHKLYKNLGDRFIDVSSPVLPKLNTKKGMGVCAADINQDGWIDFIITGYGGNKVYINQKGKKFSSIDLDIVINPYSWSTSCAFSDLDNDGDLDLYITKYANFKLFGNSICESDNKVQGYCDPGAYKGEKDALYINDGTGIFTEASKDRGIYTGINDRGFDVIISDYDNDQDMDIYVANDGSNNRLYINNGKGFFTDNGLVSGTAINSSGVAEASMGVSIGDFNNNGLKDIFITHFSLESNTFYKNHGNNNFSDVTSTIGLSKPSYFNMGWGVSFVDINNDSYEDIIIANGHFNNFIQKIDSRQNFNQENQIFINNQGQNFSLLPFKKSFIPNKNKSSRGMAYGDWNNDGKVDLAINNVYDEIDVFKNSDNNTNNWIGIKLIGNRFNRSAIGTKVTVRFKDIMLHKEIRSGNGFLSHSDLRLVFGLDKYKANVEISIIWPDGKKQTEVLDKLNVYQTIKYKL